MLDDDFYLWDTPGMLWPRITVPESGYKLAASGAVGRNAYDEEEVALELLAYLQRHYAPLLDARYRLGLDAAAIAALHDDELLALIARKRGAVMSGGRVNLQKAAELVMTDFRSAILGRITLETPPNSRPGARRRRCRKPPGPPGRPSANRAARGGRPASGAEGGEGA